MTKRYPLRGAFCGGDSGDTRDLERIAFGVLEAAYGGDYARLHCYKSLGFGGARGYLLGGDVDHLYFAAFSVVGEFWHAHIKSNDLTQSSLRAQRAQGAQRRNVKLCPCAAGLAWFLQ